nr:immunoglobulin light chain junction region [Macaca mulatta]
CQQGYSAPYSF